MASERENLYKYIYSYIYVYQKILDPPRQRTKTATASARVHVSYTNRRHVEPCGGLYDVHSVPDGKPAAA